jgi:tRNA threonylcarbamoyladenosine modification (KEOPS) complex Cgi121 subunit
LAAFAKAFLCPARLRSDKIRLKLALQNPGAVIQTMKAEKVNNEFFLEMLAAQTLLAQSSGALLAKRPEIDFLLRLAGTAQISTAISRLGSKAGEPFLAVVAGNKEINVPRELGPFELKRKVLSKVELEKIEEAALLDAERA